MLYMHPSRHSQDEVPAIKPVKRRRVPGIVRLLPFLLLMVLLVGCADGDPPPPALCDVYDRAIFTLRLLGGAAVLIGLGILGFKKNISTILPSQGAQTGAIAGSLALGLILLAFTTDIGSQILTGFGIPNLWTLCGF